MNPHVAPSRPSARQAGFSLLEVLIGVLLISFALLGLMALQARTVQLSSEAEDVQRASLLATELASRMWLVDNLAVPDADLEAWQARVADAKLSGLPGGVGSVQVNGSTARVTISWAPPRAGGASSTYVTDVLMPRAPSPAASGASS